MESLQIRTGEIKLQILDDSGEERGIFKFNPEDVKVAERIMGLQEEFQIKQKEFQAKVPECETAEAQVKLLTEIVDYFKGLVDECFGVGTSALVFGDSNTLGMFEDFFTGITPYYQKASEKRLAKYGVTK